MIVTYPFPTKSLYISKIIVCNNLSFFIQTVPHHSLLYIFHSIPQNSNGNFVIEHAWHHTFMLQFKSFYGMYYYNGQYKPLQWFIISSKVQNLVSFYILLQLLQLEFINHQTCSNLLLSNKLFTFSKYTGFIVHKHFVNIMKLA